MRSWLLTAAQRRALERQWERTHDAGMCLRLLALLHVGQGESISQVARWLHVGRRSVYHWVERFSSNQTPLALADRRGQGRPPIWDQEMDDLLETALAQPPSQLGYPANSWTVPVLQALLAVYYPQREVSTWTVRRRLKQLGYTWKRFRYVLAPDPEAEKKTSAPAPNPGPAHWHRAFGRRRNRPVALSSAASRVGGPRSAGQCAHLGV